MVQLPFSWSLPFYPLRCPLYWLTGIHCPTCGLGRAVRAALRGDWATSFHYHPLAIPLLVALVLLCAAFLFRPSMPRRVFSQTALFFRAHRRFGICLILTYCLWGFGRWLVPGALAEGVTHAPYLKSVDPSVTITTILTVGQSVPRTSNPSQSFRLIGIPDGIGWSKDATDKIHLFVNHELKKTGSSQPIPGLPLHQGAFVSEFILAGTPPRILSGDYAATTFFNGMTRLPISGSVAKLCSGTLAGPNVGFDRPIYLTGEEDSGRETFDGRGGLAFAFVGGAAYSLPEFGRYQKENLVVLPGTGLKTVIFGLEDGPKGLNSQLYLYVGEKKLSSTHVLERNGLVGGKLYVLASSAIGKGDEGSFHKADHGIIGKWIPVANGATLTDAELDKAVKESGAFNFDRIEDGTYDRKEKGVFYFVSTGGSSLINRKGRLYKLTLDPNDPVGRPVVLEILLEGDAGDPIVSPDNIDMNASGEMIIEEDFTTINLFTLLRRNPSLWSYHPVGGTLKRIAEVTSGSWEPSGVTDASDLFGPGSWLVDVQAHSIGSAEASSLQKIEGDGHLVEGGQILLLRTLQQQQ